MTPQETKHLERILTKTPKSLWGYMGFMLPMLIILIGVILNALMVWYFKTKAPIEIVALCDDKITPLWDNDLIRRVTLTTSMCIVATGALLALLGRECLRQKHLIQNIIRRMKEDDQQPPGA